MAARRVSVRVSSVDLTQIDSTGASKDWTEDQRDDYAFLLTDDAGNWVLWRNLDYRDVEPFRGINERDATGLYDSEQGSLLDFFKAARDNSRKVNVYVIDTTKVYIGLALRLGWDVPSFGSFSGFEAQLEGKITNLNQNDRQIVYQSSALTGWSFSTPANFLIRTVSQTGRSGWAPMEPVRRDIRKANRLRSAEAMVPIDLTDTTIEIVTIPPPDAVSAEYFYQQDVESGDDEDAASSGILSTSTPGRIRVTGLNPERFTRFHVRYLGAPGTTTRQSQWMGCLYRTLEDPNYFDVPPVSGAWFDPVTETSAVARWPEVSVTGRPGLDIEYVYRVETDGLLVASGQTENLSVSLSGLNPSRIYTVRLNARVGARSGPSRSYTLVTLSTIQVPKNLNLKSMTLTSATFEVDPLDCIDAYQWVLEDELGNVIQTRNTSEPKISWTGIRASRRHRQVVSAVQAGQSSQRTSLQFTTCLTSLYRGEQFTTTLAETSATFADVPYPGRPQYISCANQAGNPSCQDPGSNIHPTPPHHREWADCKNYIAAINVPTEPDFAGGKLAVVRPRIRVPVGREPTNMCETGSNRAFPIDFEAKTGNLFTQSGFTALALSGKSLYMRFMGQTYEVPGTWTFESTSLIRLTPSFPLNARYTEETTRIGTDGRSPRWPPTGYEWIVEFGNVPFGGTPMNATPDATMVFWIAQELPDVPGVIGDSVDGIIFGPEGDDDTPTLRWEALDGATGYDVSIFRGESLGLQRASTTSAITEDCSSLQAGLRYIANVVASTDGRLHLPRTVEIKMPGQFRGGAVGSTEDLVPVSNIRPLVDKDRILVNFDPATTGGEHTTWGFRFRGIVGYVDEPYIEIVDTAATFADLIEVWPVTGSPGSFVDGPSRSTLVRKSGSSVGPIIPGCIDVLVTNIDGDRACLRWNVPWGGTKYVFKTNAGNTGTGFGVIYTNGSSVTGLSLATEYFYGARPVSAEGREGIQDVENFTTSSFLSCGTPTTTPCPSNPCEGGVTVFVCGTIGTPPCPCFCPPEFEHTPPCICTQRPCPPGLMRSVDGGPCFPEDPCDACPPCQRCRGNDRFCTDDPCPPDQVRDVAGECCRPSVSGCPDGCTQVSEGRCCNPPGGTTCTEPPCRTGCGSTGTPPCPCPPCTVRSGDVCVREPLGQGTCRGRAQAWPGRNCCTEECPPNQNRLTADAPCCPTAACPEGQVRDGKTCDCVPTPTCTYKRCTDGSIRCVNIPCPAPCAGTPPCPDGQFLTRDCTCEAQEDPVCPPQPSECTSLDLVCPPGQCIGRGMCVHRYLSVRPDCRCPAVPAKRMSQAMRLLGHDDPRLFRIRVSGVPAMQSESHAMPRRAAAKPGTLQVRGCHHAFPLRVPGTPEYQRSMRGC